MDKYIKQERIASGSFATVYKAVNKENGKLMAIKNCKKGGKNSLQQEYLLTNKLSHPHIVKNFDYFTDEFFEYIVMEYCEKDLLTFVNNTDILEESKVKEIFTQICFGIKFLHNHNIVHSDIKLENILLIQGKIKLADFGLSEIFNVNKREYVKGSLHYSAPEVFIGVPIIGPSLDIWSLGIVLHALLTKKIPLILKNNNLQNNLIAYLKIAIDGVRVGETISKSARNLLSDLLQVQVEKRIDMDKILVHPWLFKLDLSKIKDRPLIKQNTPTEAEDSPLPGLSVPQVN